MSFFGDIAHNFKKRPIQNTLLALGTGGLGTLAAEGLSKIPHTTAKEKRDTMAATTAQIGYYTEAKNQLIAQAAENEVQKSIERAKINEKAIRARRNAFRGSASNVTAPVTSDLQSTLG